MYEKFFRFFFFPFTVFVFLQGCFSQASGDITPEQAENMLSSGKSITAPDVRTPDEFATGHIPGDLLRVLTECAEKLRQNGQI